MNDDHLDDEALSAFLDDEAGPEEAAHVDSCAACRDQVEQLRHAAALVGQAVPIDPTRRQAAIVAALAASLDPPTSNAVVRPLHPLRRRPAAWVLSAAAGLLTVVATVAVIDRGGDPDGRPTAQSGDASELGSTTDDDEALTMEAGAPVDAGDLGDLGDPGFTERINTALTAPDRTAAEASDQAEASDSADNASTACESTLREDDPSLGTLKVTGTGHVDGEPVTVFGFDVPGEEPLSLRVYAVALEDCSIRFFSTFAGDSPTGLGGSLGP